MVPAAGPAQVWVALAGLVLGVACQLVVFDPDQDAPGAPGPVRAWRRLADAAALRPVP